MKIDVFNLPVISPDRTGVPWAGISKFVCIGLNYVDRPEEENLSIPTR